MTTVGVTATIKVAYDPPSDILTVYLDAFDSVGNLISGEYIVTPATVGEPDLKGITYRNFYDFNLPSSVAVSSWSANWKNQPQRLAVTLYSYFKDSNNLLNAPLTVMQMQKLLNLN